MSGLLEGRGHVGAGTPVPVWMLPQAKGGELPWSAVPLLGLTSRLTLAQVIGACVIDGMKSRAVELPPGALPVPFPSQALKCPQAAWSPKTRPQSSALPLNYVTSGIGLPPLGLISFLSREGFKAAV